ncbi:MAG: ComEC/Rec2 family competence protein [Phycisphaerae bacterium]|nr:ComEC/Rec2 family competence protein [Phycisphaerae bacterium]
MDPIRRQLEWLDGQTGSGPLLLRWASVHPMVFPAVGLMIGIAIQYLLSLPSGYWPLIALVFMAGCWIAFRRNPGHRTEILSIACLLLCICVGGLRLIVFWQPGPNDIRQFLGEDKSIASLRGRVIGEPFAADKDSWVFGRYSWSGSGSTLYLRLSEGLTTTGWFPVSGTIRVDCRETIEHVHGGDRIELAARIGPINGPMNPGQYDLKKALARRGIFLAASVKSAQGFHVLSKPSDRWIWAGLLRLQRIVNSALVDDSMLGRPAEAMVSALVLGQTRQIDPAVYETFRRTGLAHFICLSGMQMAILAGFLWKLGCAIQLNKRGRAAITLAISILYILIVPPNPATTRAAVICWFFCVAVLVRRIPDSKNTLALAATVMLLIRPTDLMNISWQLSFSTVAGILLFDRSIRHRLLMVTTDQWSASAARLSGIGRWILYDAPMAAVLMLSMGLSAWLAGSGVMLYHFGTITPWASVFTVLVNPLVLGITVLGFLKLVIIGWLPSLSLLLGVIVAALSDTMTWATQILSKVPFCQIRIGRVGLAWIAVLYLLMWGLAFCPMRWPVTRMLRALLAIFGILLLCGMAWKSNRSKDLEMTCLAVGPGQAIVLRLPGGDAWLIDAGSQTSPNIGQRMVLPFLRQAGIDRLKGVVLSHADTDHFNGLPEIAAVVPIERLLANAAFCEKAKTLSGAGFLRQSMEKHGYSIEEIKFAAWPEVPARIRPLWPPPGQQGDPTLSDNDQSQVLLVEYADRRILICSDIESGAQSSLLTQYPDLKADVVVLPHHGSSTTMRPSFLEALAPSTVIASCASSRVTSAWKPSDSAVTAWYTGRDGAITVRIKADGTLRTIGFAHNPSGDFPRGE